MKSFIVGLLLASSLVAASRAATVFTEDFESELDGWIGKDGGIHHGATVPDPFQADNQVLTFTALNSLGDMFTSGPGFAQGKYILTFDYLGMENALSVVDNLGGFVGISNGTPGDHRWLIGTTRFGGAESDLLIDDGTWHHYEIPFTSNFSFNLMLEDFSGSGGVAGDAFFDNIVLEVNEPCEGSGNSSSAGDPHLFTFDGLYYDNQLIGEFVLSREKGVNGFELQVRQQRIPGCSQCVTFNTVAAARLGADTVEYRAQTDEVLVDEIPVELAEGEVLDLLGGGYITRNKGIMADNGTGCYVRFRDFGSFLNVTVKVSCLLEGNVEGLLGNFDGDVENEFQLRDGTQALSKNEFMADWRLADSESLFTYPPDTRTYTYLGTQDCHIHIANGDLEAARQLCIAQYGEGQCNDAMMLAMATDLAAGMTEEQVFAWIDDIKDDIGHCVALWYEDLDGDEYGNPEVSLGSITQPVGYVPDRHDCNDNDDSSYTGISYYRNVKLYEE